MGGVLVTASGVAFAASEQVKVFWEQPATALGTAKKQLSMVSAAGRERGPAGTLR